MATPVTEAASFKFITASTTLSIPNLKLLGFLCSTSSLATIQLLDNVTAITGAITLTAGQFYACPVEVSTSLVANISGTAGVTLFYSV